MRKYALFAFALVLAWSCKDDDQPSSQSYPTDGLALPEQKEALLIGSYRTDNGYSIDFIRRILQDHGGEDIVNYMSVVNDKNSPLYVGLADSIAFNQPLFPAPALYLNEENLDPTGDMPDELDFQLGRPPLLSVNHAVSGNDTAWIIDSKVRIWRDTAAQFHIETYMLANIQAAFYSKANIDFRATPQTGFMRTVDSFSVFDFDLIGTDSTIIVPKDSPYYHERILVAGQDEHHPFGTPLGDYTPFGTFFSANDLIGTETTPIKHYFLKPDSRIRGAYKPDFPFTPTFLTVVWNFDEDSGKYIYVNSVSTTLD